MPSFTVAELAEHVGGTVQGDGTRVVDGVAPVAEAGPGDLTYVVSGRYARALEDSAPGAVLASPDLGRDRDHTFIHVSDPQLAFSRCLELFFPPKEREPGIHPTATLGRGVRLGAEVRVGPHAVLGDDVRVGDATTIGAFTVIGDGARIGSECAIAHHCSVLHDVRIGDRVRLHPGVRVGTDGFGYAQDSDGAVKIPQVGGCVLEDDVEVGANSTIDRGSLGDTVVGSGTKIDNLVHIGHNVEIGRNCMIVAQVGIAGSVQVGDRVSLAGQAGIAGHLRIGSGARIAAQAGVIGDVPEGASYSGYPARPHREAMKASAVLFRLPELLRRIRGLERELGMRAPATDSNGGER